MDLRTKQRAVVDALEDIKGYDIVVYNTAALPTMFERVVIASGDSNRQIRALADHVQDKLSALGAKVYGVEGTSASEWVLVDFGDLVVHVMHPTVRGFYKLEEIWGGKSVRMSKTPEKAPEKKPAKKPARRKAAPRGKTPRPRRRK
ncbi:MAG TPA: ribosome silencing factor [Burkholderiales bacterium]|nr:ribosome silencing factor [Burkholderiales bacterium]